MAVTFKPHKSGKTLLIGGQSATTGTGGGLVGPFPKFSMNREELSAGDGTYLGTKYTIDITGIATINPSDTQDITTKGLRQSRIQGEAITAMQFDRSSFPAQGTGLLEISPYGGLSNTIKFNDARLLSVSLPEQEDATAGVQNLQYSFNFEAYDEASSNTNTGTTGSPASPEYRLSNAEESWDLSENDTVFYKSNNPTQSIHKTYTLTHTLSATGLKKYDSHTVMADDGEAWRQASLWVKDKLKTSTSIRDNTTEDLTGDTAFWLSQFNPIQMNKGADAGNVSPDLKGSTPSYKGYNHVRTVNSDLSAGTYGVTETWILCDQTLTATHDLEINIEDDKGPFVTVSVNATFQGLNTGAASDTTVDRFDQAETSYNAMTTHWYNIANTAYTGAGYTNSLRNVKMTESIGQNRTAGIITYSTSFNDQSINIDGALSEEININYDNTEGLNEVIAKIPIIGKVDGPVIQDMGTTTIKSVSANLDAVMDRDNRSSRPTSAATTVLNTYKPTAGKQQTKTESWNPKSGAYNLSISWEYV